MHIKVIALLFIFVGCHIEGIGQSTNKRYYQIFDIILQDNQAELLEECNCKSVKKIDFQRVIIGFYPSDFAVFFDSAAINNSSTFLADEVKQDSLNQVHPKELEFHSTDLLSGLFERYKIKRKNKMRCLIEFSEFHDNAIYVQIAWFYPVLNVRQY